MKEMFKQLKENDKTVAVTATTGIASTLYSEFNATTIHRWSGIGDGRHDVNEVRQVCNQSKFVNIIV